MRIGFLGDIIGKPGRDAILSSLQGLKQKYRWDFIIANCENAAAGFGVTSKIAEELLAAGVDVLTSGNHIWDQKGIEEYLQKTSRLLRPANYPHSERYPIPGVGHVIVEAVGGKGKVAVINLMGRTFMEAIDCPFIVGEKVLKECLRETSLIVIDFHGETTSEKRAAGWFFSGKASAVIGTHTHVQTADEAILSGGTGYITDAGMCGPEHSVIGMEIEPILFRFLTKRKVKFEVAKEGVTMMGVTVELDPSSGKCIHIERFREPWKTP